MRRDFKKRQGKGQNCRKLGFSISRPHLKTFTEKRQYHTYILLFVQNKYTSKRCLKKKSEF